MWNLLFFLLPGITRGWKPLITTFKKEWQVWHITMRSNSLYSNSFKYSLGAHKSHTGHAGGEEGAGCWESQASVWMEWLDMTKYPHTLMLSSDRRLYDREIFNLTTVSLFSFSLFFFFLHKTNKNCKNNIYDVEEQIVPQAIVRNGFAQNKQAVSNQV